MRPYVRNTMKEKSKIGIVSDLHLDMDNLQIKRLEIPADLNCVVVAGDIHPDINVRSRFLADLELYANCPLVWVPGNHDYWGSTPANFNSTFQTKIDDLDFAGATLWTKLSPVQWFPYVMGLRDEEHIDNWQYDRYDLCHESQKRFLFGSGADVIVSHHAPSYQSVTSQFRGDNLNCCFVNDLDRQILNLPKPPKLWIHGHVHSEHDYMIGDTRVVCHPRGYRFEPRTFDNYQMKVVEV